MNKKKLTNKDIRRIAGVSKPTVIRWLNGKNSPHLAMQKALFKKIK